jgi:hypothetical protein
VLFSEKLESCAPGSLKENVGVCEMSEQQTCFFSAASLEMGMSRGVSPATRSDVRDFRLVALTFAWPTCSSAVKIREVGNFCAACTDLGPWVRLEHFVFLPLLGSSLGDRSSFCDEPSLHLFPFHGAWCPGIMGELRCTGRCWKLSDQHREGQGRC